MPGLNCTDMLSLKATRRLHLCNESALSLVWSNGHRRQGVAQNFTL